MRGVDEGWVRPTTYVVSFPRVLKSVKYPMLVCPVVAHSSARQWENFMYQDFRSQVDVVKEGGGGSCPAVNCVECICQQGGS